MDDFGAAIGRLEAGTGARKLRGIEAVYRFEATSGETWTLSVEDGRLAVRPGDGKADCTIRGEPQDLLRIARGEEDLLIAVMQGRVTISGSVPLAQGLLMALRASNGRS